MYTKLRSARQTKGCSFLKRAESETPRSQFPKPSLVTPRRNGPYPHLRRRIAYSLRQDVEEIDKPILREAWSQVYPVTAICVQRFDDSLSSAIRITYRISLRSSSLREPRYPLLRVVQFTQIDLHQASLTNSQFLTSKVLNSTIFW